MRWLWAAIVWLGAPRASPPCALAARLRVNDQLFDLVEGGQKPSLTSHASSASSASSVASVASVASAVPLAMEGLHSASQPASASMLLHGEPNATQGSEGVAKRGGDFIDRMRQTLEDSIRKQPLTTAVFASLLGSVLTVIGYVLQKIGMREPHNHYRIGDVVLSWAWITGFILVNVTGVPLLLFMYSLAPVSLIAPLSGVVVILNLAVAPILLKEQIYCWPDVPATALILVGMVISSRVGAHPELQFHSKELWARFGDPDAQCLLVGTAAILGTCMAAMHLKDRRHDDEARDATAADTSKYEMLLPALAAAAGGMLANISLKMSSLVLKSESFWVAIPFLLMTILPGLLQINYMSRAVRLHPQAVIIPICVALSLLFVTFGGSLFFREGEMFSRDAGVIFVLAVLSITVGIGLFLFREEPQVVK